MAKPNGEIRLSQLISTYGPGALTDLPDYSVLISGLSFWRQDGTTGHLRTKACRENLSVV